MLAAPFGGLPLQPLPIGSTPAQAQQVRVSFSIFFDRLARYGTWVRSARYHYVWCPDVESDWAPYTTGHWIHLADRGWYFASDDPYAWAVYHYGRWYIDADLGWCWVPGNVWAPAWVTWRRGDDYVGWAPLPPESSGFSIGISISTTDVPRGEWVFVPAERFLAPRLRTTVVFANDKPDVWTTTRPVGPVIVQNNIVINNVININFIEQHTHQKVESVKAQTVDQPDAASPKVQGQTIQIFAANLQKPTGQVAPKQALDKTEARHKLGNKPPPGSGQGLPPGPSGQTQAGNGQPPPPANGQVTEKGLPSNQANGKTKLACLPKDMVNGVCPPPKGNGKPSGASGASGQGSGPNGNTGLVPGQKGSPQTSGKGGSKVNGNAAKILKCPPNEMLVNGRCVPAGNGKSSKSGGAGPNQAPLMNNAGPPKNSGKGSAATEGQPAFVPGAKGQGASPNGNGNVPKVLKCPPGEILVKGVCRPRQDMGAQNGGQVAAPMQ